MNQQINDFIAALAGAQISLIGILLSHLDEKTGQDIRSSFTADLKRILVLDDERGRTIPPCQRMIFEQVANWVSPAMRWRPVIITGSNDDARETTTRPSSGDILV